MSQPTIMLALRWCASLAPFVLAPSLLVAQTDTTDILSNTLTLDAFLRVRAPIVHSFARSVLYTSRGARVYDKELILALQVADEDARYIRFNGEFVSPLGYANITTGDLPGDYEHCYSARSAAHVNADNLHEINFVSFKCIPALPDLPKPEVPDENCPIVLDLAMNGYHLSGAPGVPFDIDADGTPNRIAWTRAGEDDAFLCLDRNHNGVIDDGTELFGFSTPLASGAPAQIGYRALAEFDEPAAGGNQDGRVDARDGMFGELCAWLDRNRDGVSQRQEIYSLDQVGIVALEYGYKPLHLTDPFGNLFRYTSRLAMRGPAGIQVSWPTYDVIFANE